MIVDGQWSGSLSRSRRATVAAAVVALHALAAIALFQSRTPEVQALRERIMDVIDLQRPPPPKPVEHFRPVPRMNRPSGEAAPPNLKNVPTEIVAPRPILPPIIIPVVTPPIADRGAAANAGAALAVGPGTGAGGQGNGRGAGGSGDGDGGGYGGLPPIQTGGSLKNSDYPSAVDDTDVQGRVSVRFRVGINGRVSDCRVTQSSGSRILDDTTCRLITERFRFRPSRDEQGRPVSSLVEEDHTWTIQHD